jgi:serine/threonine-protein kinase
LLFGILALQMDFISRDALIAAMHAWVLDKIKPLGQILCEQGQLSAEQRQVLNALVHQHVKAHHNDPQQSLAAIAAPAAVCQQLRSLADAEVQASLDSVAEVQDTGTDPDATGPFVPSSPDGGTADRYRVLRPHARGGLGEVLVAEDAHLHREVAVKRIRAERADDAHSRSRFLLEAEVTGRLEHPGIVPVHDLGQDADGRPYYVMKLIRGETLKDAIRRFHQADVPGREPGERRLALRQLLGRFVAVCNAIAYAHSRGVLNRDCKPDNCLLGPFNETLVVDWGLAKAVGRPEGRDDAAGATLQPTAGTDLATQTGIALGTPAYMSPEAASGRVPQLGPATDVYSLGATLYCVLVGQPPFSGQDVGQILQQVQQGAWRPPSQVKQDVPPALEAICRKALALRPQDRYATALALAAEVEHWLADEPVTAHREAWPARLGRWGRRHRGLTAGGLAALAVGMVGLGLLAVVVSAKNADLALANRREREAAELAQQTIEDMTSEDALGFLERQKELRPEQRRFLEQALAYYRQAVAGTAQEEAQQARQARAYQRMGLLQQRLGLFTEAEASYAAALEKWQLLAAKNPQVPDYRRDLAGSHYHLGLLLANLGKRSEAEAEYRAALKEQERLVAEHPQVPDYHSELTGSHNRLGILLADLGKWSEAEGEYRAALKERERLVAEHPQVPDYRRDLAGSHNNLGNVLADLGRRSDAEGEYRAALKELERLVAEHPQVPQYRQDLAGSHLNLGLLQAGLGKRSDAEGEYRAALKEQERLVAEHPQVPDYRQVLAGNHYNLGMLLADQGKRSEAEGEYRAALKEQERLVAEHPQVPDYRHRLAVSHNNLGNVLADQGKRSEAEALYRAALKESERLVAEHPQVPDYRKELAQSHYNVGLLLVDQGKRSEAEGEYRAALKEQERLVAEHPQVPDYRQNLANTHNNLGLLLADLGNRSEAEAQYRAALKERERLVAEYPQVPGYAVDLGESYTNLGTLLRDGSQPDQALAWYTKAIATLEAALRTLGADVTARQFLRNGHRNRAQVLTRLGRFAEAVADWDRALALDDGPDRNFFRLGRALTLTLAGKHARATAETEELLQTGPASAGLLYDAACVFAVASGSCRDTALTERYAVRAVALLRQAVAKGWKNFAHLQKDPDLDPLRQRADFQKLLAELEKGTPPSK